MTRLFGRRVAEKASVQYPLIEQQVDRIVVREDRSPRFVFVGTQFEIKGGGALLRAWPSVVKAIPGAHLDLVTHLPAAFADLVTAPGIALHDAKFSRDLIWSRFLREADVLVLPSYYESFGMIALEALSHGLALIVTDVFALPELVVEGFNGSLIHPPVSVWDNGVPTPLHYSSQLLIDTVRALDTSAFEDDLAKAMISLGRDPDALLLARQNSLHLFKSRFDGRGGPRPLRMSL
ncbi:glycosyltransferase family 4 protein [Rhodopseudomonas palustris]|uniref:glycosyltransferase family 4 protein n=1 Tax=Rhodopseudomonas palustris TaxID=1076 RepID=UPI0022F095CF|nr:glycosyltransferase family 4 protein [Rhodopseudomonas palustris]WBU31261.1 glycosyltransferase family 4 protein [Rhodopseudomonas palustris]